MEVSPAVHGGRRRQRCTRPLWIYRSRKNTSRMWIHLSGLNISLHWHLGLSSSSSKIWKPCRSNSHQSVISVFLNQTKIAIRHKLDCCFLQTFFPSCPLRHAQNFLSNLPLANGKSLLLHRVRSLGRCQYQATEMRAFTSVVKTESLF